MRREYGIVAKLGLSGLSKLELLRLLERGRV